MAPPQSNFTRMVHELDPSHVQRFNVWNYNHTVNELKEITFSLQALHCSSTGDPTSCNGLQTFVTFWMNGVTYTPGGLAYGGQQWGTNRYAGNGHIKLGSDERLVKHLFFSSLWPSDAMRRRTFGSILAQVMAWCLTAPSHYLNQCWLVSSERSKDIHLRRISQEISQASTTKVNLKITWIKIHSNLPGANELTNILTH